MKTSKIISATLLVATAFLMIQCERDTPGCTDPRSHYFDPEATVEDNSCYDLREDADGCDPYTYGNLVVTNKTESVLYIYNNGDDITCIPALAENYLVDVPNPDLSVCQLQVWKTDDVPRTEQPDISEVYRTWNVALSNTTLESERSFWIITDDSESSSSGTLDLSYSATDDYGQSVIYQVDIMLNSKNGAKIASLQPGAINKRVSVDYGVHYLYFRYWYSDPNSHNGEIEEIGWNEIQGVVINAEHDAAEIEIPIYYSNVGKYGQLKILNLTANAINIFANDVLIETIAKVDGSSQGLSVVPAQNSTTYLIPLDSYTITAKSLDGSSVIQNISGLDIIENDLTNCWIGSSLQSISVMNNTGHHILITNRDGEYLGKYLKPGQKSGTFLVPNIYDTLRAITPDKLMAEDFRAGLNATISNLTGFSTLDFEITQAWTLLGENYYESLDINHGQSTAMTANLDNPNMVTLTFEYKVSSETSYDFFNFLIDDSYHLYHTSGDLDWQTFTTTIEAGEHKLRWEYVKDAMIEKFEDKVQIRNITIE